MTITEIGKKAKETAGIIGIQGSARKNEGLKAAAAALLEGEAEILAANQEDVIKAAASGMNAGLIDRLELTPARIEAMGYEWQGSGLDGDHNVFFLHNNGKQEHPMRYQDLAAAYEGQEVIGIPHHLAYQPGSRGKNWDTHNETFSPIAEIYSSHGSSENDDGPLSMDRHDAGRKSSCQD